MMLSLNQKVGRSIIMPALILMFPTVAKAADGVVNDGLITLVRAYETSDGSTSVFLGVNGRRRVGPNPDEPAVDCELWTNSEQVYSLALTAKTSAQRVNVRYVPRGENKEFCTVRFLELIE